MTKKMLLVVGSMVMLSGTAQVAWATSADAVLNTTKANQKRSAASQTKVDGLHDRTQELLAEYRSVQEKIASLQVYNRQVQTLIDAQEREMADLSRQIEDATTVGREVTPLMLRMLEGLENFVALDVPFLQEERQKRIASLKGLMNQADVTDSEKYRRLLEAYQIENEYGRTIEAYQAAVDVGLDDGGSRTLDFLRIGRVTLMYQSLDGQHIGMWNSQEQAWQALPDAYKSSMRKGLRMARKQAAPDLIRLPIVAAQEAS